HSINFSPTLKNSRIFLFIRIWTVFYWSILIKNNRCTQVTVFNSSFTMFKLNHQYHQLTQDRQTLSHSRNYLRKTLKTHCIHNVIARILTLALVNTHPCQNHRNGFLNLRMTFPVCFLCCHLRLNGIFSSVIFSLLKLHQRSSFITFLIASTYLLDTLLLLTNDKSSSNGELCTYLPLKNKSVASAVTPALCMILVSFHRLNGSVAQQNSISSTILGPILK